ncbi:LysM domain-containing protein [Marininema mesophilum]|uniref:LysM domain-containing protein n=1 Tax=Marininema mesophilum TaxID=1048340 RepID=A0A1H2ZIZ0_9BACL|nr:LysM peptidoglycan-binding domain-containing protein [Marininema mesophilum]SDX17351.1 LysM domain-containing protein [Marininema mesophilum]
MRRWSLFCGLFLVPIIGFWAFIGDSQASKSDSFQTVEVKAGETIWSLAHLYGDPKDDIRKTVDVIQEANQLDTAIIQPGQKLRVPIASEKHDQ